MKDELLSTPILKNLKIIKGARHCRIVDDSDEIVFRTTNLRDAEAFLRLVEENRRLHRLLEARGIAPHRIYLLENSDSSDEVVIVAKAGPDAVVVRHLDDGREEGVDLDEIKDLPEADYFFASEKPLETIHVSVRFDPEVEGALISAHRSQEGARATRDVWRRASFEPDKEDLHTASWTTDNAVVFAEDIELED
jgi:hypothetical protein